MFLSTVRTSQHLPSDPLYGNRRLLVLTTIMRKKSTLAYIGKRQENKGNESDIRMIQQNKIQHLGVFVVGEMRETTARKLSTEKILHYIFTRKVFSDYRILTFCWT